VPVQVAFFQNDDALFFAVSSVEHPSSLHGEVGSQTVFELHSSQELKSLFGTSNSMGHSDRAESRTGPHPKLEVQLQGLCVPFGGLVQHGVQFDELGLVGVDLPRLLDGDQCFVVSLEEVECPNPAGNMLEPLLVDPISLLDDQNGLLSCCLFVCRFFC